MLSSKLVEARPVRTEESLWRKSSITFSILVLVSLLTSLTILSSKTFGEFFGANRLFSVRSGLRPDDRAYALSCHRAFDIARLGHIEDEDRQIVVFAERDSGGVHHREF